MTTPPTPSPPKFVAMPQDLFQEIIEILLKQPYGKVETTMDRVKQEVQHASPQNGRDEKQEDN